jgi:hypothetical protein
MKRHICHIQISIKANKANMATSSIKGHAHLTRPTIKSFIPHIVKYPSWF